MHWSKTKRGAGPEVRQVALVDKWFSSNSLFVTVVWMIGDS